MDISIFLAKFWGWYLIIFFVVLSFNPKRIKQIFDDMRDQKFAILAAFLAIIVGLINILLHNVWEADWRLIITVIGWLALLLGLLLLSFPKWVVSGLVYLNIKLVQVFYILLLLAGVFLLNIGYQIIPY